MTVVSGPSLWTADAPQSSYALMISDLGAEGGAFGSKAWPAVHGTLTASLIARPGTAAAGTVTLSATF